MLNNCIFHTFIAIATKFRLVVGYVIMYVARCTYAGFDVNMTSQTSHFEF